ncbi:hypothetical protein [Streptomyces sp. CA-179760]
MDLVIAATAAQHGLTLLRTRADHRAVARPACDLLERNVHDIA